MADDFAGKGVINFNTPDKKYGDTYNDRRDVVKNVARQQRDSGATVGTDGRGTWTVKSSRSQKRSGKRA